MVCSSFVCEAEGAEFCKYERPQVVAALDLFGQKRLTFSKGGEFVVTQRISQITMEWCNTTCLLCMMPCNLQVQEVNAANFAGCISFMCEFKVTGKRFCEPSPQASCAECSAGQQHIIDVYATPYCLVKRKTGPVPPTRDLFGFTLSYIMYRGIEVAT
jgi:hypothetical protein